MIAGDATCVVSYASVGANTGRCSSVCRIVELLVLIDLADAAADQGLAVAGRVVGEAEARTDRVLRVLGVSSCQS